MPTCSSRTESQKHLTGLTLSPPNIDVPSPPGPLQIGKGYRIAHLLERDGEPDTLDRPLPKYEEVLLQNLKHDMRDVELVKVRRCGVWGCGTRG